MSANQTAIDESVLRTIKTVESGLSNKIDLIAAQINQKMLMINEKMDSMSSEYKHLTSNLSEYKFKLDKVDQFTSFQNKANDLLTTHDIRINSMMSELSSAKIKYDKIFIDKAKNIVILLAVHRNIFNQMNKVTDSLRLRSRAVTQL